MSSHNSGPSSSPKRRPQSTASDAGTDAKKDTSQPKFLKCLCFPHDPIARQPLERLLKIIAVLYVLSGLGSLGALPFFAATLKIFEACFAGLTGTVALVFAYYVWNAAKTGSGHKARIAIRLLFVHFGLICIAYCLAVFFFPSVTFFLWTAGLASGGISLLIFAAMAFPAALCKVLITLFVYYVLWSFHYYHDDDDDSTSQAGGDGAEQRKRENLV